MPPVTAVTAPARLLTLCALLNARIPPQQLLMHGLPALLLARLVDESAMVRVAAAGAIRCVSVQPALWLPTASA